MRTQSQEFMGQFQGVPSTWTALGQELLSHRLCRPGLPQRLNTDVLPRDQNHGSPGRDQVCTDILDFPPRTKVDTLGEK